MSVVSIPLKSGKSFTGFISLTFVGILAEQPTDASLILALLQTSTDGRRSMLPTPLGLLSLIARGLVLVRAATSSVKVDYTFVHFVMIAVTAVVQASAEGLRRKTL